MSGNNLAPFVTLLSLAAIWALSGCGSLQKIADIGKPPAMTPNGEPDASAVMAAGDYANADRCAAAKRDGKPVAQRQPRLLQGPARRASGPISSLCW